MSSRERITHVLASGGGLASRSDLIAAGISRWTVSRQLASGAIREVLPGVLALKATKLDAADWLRAAVLYAGPGAALTGQTALAVMQVAETPRVKHVAVPNGRKVPDLPGLRVTQRRPRERLDIAGQIVVPPLEALAVSAVDGPIDRLRFWAADAVQSGLVLPADLNRAVAPTAGRRALRLVAEEIAAGAISGGEARYWRLIKDALLPLPVLNAPVATDSGTRYVDALWENLRLGVEIDGRTAHAQAAAFDVDRLRQNALFRAGVVLVRFTVAQVMNAGEMVVAHTRLALAARSAELRLPPAGTQC